MRFLFMFPAIAVVVGAISNSTNSTVDCTGINAVRPACISNETLYRRDFFYIGGSYVYDNSSSGILTEDQMYVEKLTPAAGVTQSIPLVFFHGGGVSGATWLNTPDNRKGWASYFIDLGYQVYIVDQTSVGRGSQNDITSYDLRYGSTVAITEAGFTAPELTDAYPQSQNHTQWPGNGTQGDPIFDAFESTFIPLTLNKDRQELSMRHAGCALLSLIGPSFLISHSIGASWPVLISDECPDLVEGNISIEPGNIPFESYVGNATSPVGRTAARPYGLTVTPLTFEPPANSSSDIVQITVGVDTPANRSCILQAEPARQLPNLAKVPYVAFTGEASPHATYDHCVISFLNQAGVQTDWIKLGEIGIHGNAHFMAVELNNLDIAAVVQEWIEGKVKR